MPEARELRSPMHRPRDTHTDTGIRGYGDPPPQTLIVLGLSAHYVNELFQSCELAGHTKNNYSVLNEETKDHPDIFVCQDLRDPWPEFWEDFRYYG